MKQHEYVLKEDLLDCFIEYGWCGPAMAVFVMERSRIQQASQSRVLGASALLVWH